MVVTAVVDPGFGAVRVARVFVKGKGTSHKAATAAVDLPREGSLRRRTGTPASVLVSRRRSTDERPFPPRVLPGHKRPCFWCPPHVFFERKEEAKRAAASFRVRFLGVGMLAEMSRRARAARACFVVLCFLVLLVSFRRAPAESKASPS